MVRGLGTMKSIAMVLGTVGLVCLVTACSDSEWGKDGEDPLAADGVGEDGDGSNTGGDGSACDPALADCDDVCACDGSALEDDCVEHECATGCTEPQGFWKENEAAWPVAELMVGGRLYDTPTLVSFMNLPTTGDASITLGTHLVATKLNLLTGVVDAELTDEIDAADAWLAANDDGDGLPLGIDASDARSDEALALASELADFNAGIVGPGACTAEESTDGAETVEE